MSILLSGIARPIFFVMIYAGLFVTLAGSGDAYAEKVYKLVGPDGKIIYTNKNPELINIGNADHEEIDVKESYSNVTPVTRVGSAMFCGNIQLPLREIGSTNFYGKVVSARKDWERAIIDLESKIAKKRRSSLEDKNFQYLKQLTEYKCARNWADEQKRNAMQEKKLLIEKSAGFNRYLEDLKNGFDLVCGEEPIYRTNDVIYMDRRNAWNRCNADYNSKMKEIQDDLKKTDQQLLDIKRILESNF